MTFRSYADFCVSSSSAKLHLEAVSLQQPGFSDETFRYRLVETERNRVLWERWQTRGEGSPVTAFVSDEGYVVVRAHWLDWGSEHLLFFNPKGKKRLVITVAAEGYLDDLPPATKPKKRRDRKKPTRLVWTDPRIQVSTGGPLWTDGSFETFTAAHFCLRTAWGRWLIVDLARMTVVPESALSDDARALLEAEEHRQAVDAVQHLAPIIESGDADWRQQARLQGARAVVGRRV